jgi:hypothetical protein
MPGNRAAPLTEFPKETAPISDTKYDMRIHRAAHIFFIIARSSDKFETLKVAPSLKQFNS